MGIAIDIYLLSSVKRFYDDVFYRRNEVGIVEYKDIRYHRIFTYHLQRVLICGQLA
jgi:hypothetical protein